METAERDSGAAGEPEAIDWDMTSGVDVRAWPWRDADEDGGERLAIPARRAPRGNGVDVDVDASAYVTGGERDATPGVDVDAWPWRGYADGERGVHVRVAEDDGVFLVGDGRGHAAVVGGLDEAIAWAVAPAVDGHAVAWAVWEVGLLGDVDGEAIASGHGWDRVTVHRRSDAIGIGGWQWRAAVTARRLSADAIVATSAHNDPDSRETFAFASAVDAAEWAIADGVDADYAPIAWAHWRVGVRENIADDREYRVAVATHGRGGYTATSSRYTLAEAIAAYRDMYAAEYPRNRIAIVRTDAVGTFVPPRRPLAERAAAMVDAAVDERVDG